MQTIDQGRDSFAALDQAILFSLVGTHAELQLLDGQHLRGLLEDWHAEREELEWSSANGGTAQRIPLSRVRCIQWHGYLAGAPTLTQYQTFAICFRDGEQLEGACLEAGVEAQGIHLCTEASDGSPGRLFVPLSAIAEYRIADHSVRVAATDTRPVPAHAIPSQAGYLLRNSSELRAYLERGSQQVLDQDPSLQAAILKALPDAVRLARQLDIPIVRLQQFDIDAGATALISEEIARRYHLIPLGLFRGRLLVALENPADEEVVRLLRFISGYGIEPCLAGIEEIEAAIHRYYGADREELLQGLQQDEDEVDETQSLREVELLGKQKPIVRLVNNLILDAMQRRASDIHIRPGEQEAELLFRIDGVLLPVRSFSRTLLPAMVARIKVLGKMDIADRRLPQDGQARILDRGAAVDLRISTIPTIAGESVVIRLLDANAGNRRLQELGLEPQDEQHLLECLQRSFGLILVTGPTGAGKSTTLYAALQEIQQRPVNIVTVEDPVEYRMPGVGQIQVNRVPGYGFARALKHILRHDPDVVMIGEIRDRETARIAVESALTGHLVLSTLHTNDAVSAVSRLVDMGIEPYLLASALTGVVAQRLVRCNCRHCLQEEIVAEPMCEQLQVPVGETFHKGGGCDECNGTGYHGREGVYEMLQVTPELRQLIVQTAPVEEMRTLALWQGMVPLTHHAIQKARSGITSLEEVYRVRLE